MTTTTTTDIRKQFAELLLELNTAQKEFIAEMIRTSPSFNGREATDAERAAWKADSMRLMEERFGEGS